MTKYRLRARASEPKVSDADTIEQLVRVYSKIRLHSGHYNKTITGPNPAQYRVLYLEPPGDPARFKSA